jgi:hypothetical protein
MNCFTHNISDFLKAVRDSGFEIADMNEYFDNNNRTSIPRILTLLFKKKSNN